MGFTQQVQYSLHQLEGRLFKGLIKAVAVDKLGFIWCATDYGLVRYDGEESVFFKDELTGGFAKALCKRRDGSLLVLHDFGLTEIVNKPDTTYFRPLLSAEMKDSDGELYYPKTIYEDSAGTIWIGENQSVVKYKSGAFTKYRLDVNRKQGILLRSYTFTEDENGTLWAFSHSGRLFRYDPPTDNFVNYPLPISIEGVASFVAMERNRFWVGTQNGLFELQIDREGTTVVTGRQISDLGGISRTLLRGKEFYIGTWNNGLFRLSMTEPLAAPERIDILSLSGVVDMTSDAENGLWVASDETLALLSPVFFEACKLPDADAVMIESISLLPGGELLTGSGLKSYLVKENQEVTNGPFETNMVQMATYADSGGIWVGTLTGEVFYYDFHEQALQQIPDIRPGNFITKITKDKRGNIWVAGNREYGLLRIDPARRVHSYGEQGLKNCKTVREAPTGVVYAGGSSADSYLFFYDHHNDRFVNVSQPMEFEVRKNFMLEDMVFDGMGNVVLATSDGLLKCNFNLTTAKERRVQRIDLQRVPVDEPIRALALGADGVLWVATTSGLVALNGETAVLFDKSSGLPSTNFTYRGVLFDRDQNLWVATANGLAFLRKQGAGQSLTPQPLITSFRLNGIRKLFSSLNQTNFPPHSNFEIDYRSLSFPAGSVNYQTRLLGRDSNWSAPAPITTAALSGLTQGDYVFQVRAQQRGGLTWSDVHSFPFTIAKPWYGKWWAVTGFVLLFFGLLATILRLYHWNLLKKNERLETLVRERAEKVNQQKSEIIRQQNMIIQQNERLRTFKEQQLLSEIEYKNKQLTTHTLNLIQKNESLKELRKKITVTARNSKRETAAELRGLLSVIDYSFRKDEDWDRFKLYFEEVYAGFHENLHQAQPNLTPLEIRHCTLIRLNLNIQETASILGISSDSVKTARFRLRKKMELPSQPSMVEYIMAI